jgi:hypothetical protein
MNKSFEDIYFICNIKSLFEQVLREADKIKSDEAGNRNQIWLNVRNILRNNINR